MCKKHKIKENYLNSIIHINIKFLFEFKVGKKKYILYYDLH